MVSPRGAGMGAPMPEPTHPPTTGLETAHLEPSRQLALHPGLKKSSYFVLKILINSAASLPPPPPTPAAHCPTPTVTQCRRRQTTQNKKGKVCKLLQQN